MKGALSDFVWALIGLTLAAVVVVVAAEAKHRLQHHENSSGQEKIQKDEHENS